MNPQDGFATAYVWRSDLNLTVEAAWSEQRPVEGVGPIGGADDNDARIGVETIHFNQELIERLLSFVVAATITSAALSADGVDLVDEDDARRNALGLIEQIAHAAGANADE